MCKLWVTVTHIEGSYTDPNSVLGDLILILIVSKYNKEILGDWAKQYCLSAPINFNSGDGSYSLIIPADPSKYEVSKFFNYVPTIVKKRALKDAEQYFNDNKGYHEDLQKDDVTVSFTIVMCGAEIDYNHHGIDNHYSHLHGIYLSDMHKYTQIKVDTNKQFKLIDAKKFHTLNPEVRRKTMGDWFESAVITGLVENGQSKRNSFLSKFVSTKFMEGLKHVLDPTYYDKLVYELEKIIKESTKVQIECKWDKIVKALDNTVGKNGQVKLAQDYFAQKSSGCGNEYLAEVIWQIKTNYQNFHGTRSETFNDEDGNESSTETRMYDAVCKEVLMVLPEGSEIKSWLERRVAELRIKPAKSIDSFIFEIEDKVESKEWRSTYEKLKVAAIDRKAI